MSEYTMLIEVSEEFEKQKIDKTAREKSGNATKIVIRPIKLKSTILKSFIQSSINQGVVLCQ